MLPTSPDCTAYTLVDDLLPTSRTCASGERDGNYENANPNAGGGEGFDDYKGKGSKQENNADEDNDAVAFRPDLRSRIWRVILHAWPFLDTDNLAIDLYDGPALELDIVNDDCAEHLIRRNKDVISVLHKAGIMGELACVQINVRDSSEIKKRALLLSRYDADVKAGIIPDVIGV